MSNNKTRVILSATGIASVMFMTAFSAHFLVFDNERIEFINTAKSVFIGENTGNNAAVSGTENAWNTAIGSDAMQYVTPSIISFTGTRNTCSGSNCMHEIINGDTNTCTGVACLYGNINGKGNTASGYHSGAHQLDNFGVFIGDFAEEFNEHAFNSVSIGHSVARNNQGKKNVLIGGAALQSAQNINNSVFIGAAISTTQISGDNNINIGFNQSLNDLSGSNQLNLGGVIRSDNIYTGHIRLRKNAGLELVDSNNKAWRITISTAGILTIVGL